METAKPPDSNNLDPLVKVVGADLDHPADGDSLARDANYSRFHFQRLFHRMTGETPGDCRRRLVLERAGHLILRTQRSITEIAFETGFDSLEGFSRAFRRAYGVSPSHYRRLDPLSWFLAAPNDIHYNPVVGAAVLLTRQGPIGGNMDLSDRLIEHDLWLTRRLLEKASALTDAQLDAPLPQPENPLPFETSHKTLRDLLNRLVITKEWWMASIHGRPIPDQPDRTVAGMLKRLDASFGEFNALVRRVRDENLWDTDFVDLLCEPPETFTYGGMIAHVITFSANRRVSTIRALQQAGITDLGYGDPIEWERALAGE
jgi:AraC-like DNA-binding protein